MISPIAEVSRSAPLLAQVGSTDGLGGRRPVSTDF